MAFRFRTGHRMPEDLLVARTHPHPRQVFLIPEAVAAFENAFKGGPHH